MKLGDINPFVRYASEFDYKVDEITVRVSDCRLFYIVSGSGEIIIENQHYNASEGTLFYIPAGSTYTIRVPSGFRLISHNFDLTQSHSDKTKVFPPCPADSNNKTSVIFTEVEDSILNAHVCREDSGDFAADLKLLIEEMATERKYYRESASCILKKILIKLHRDNAIASSKSRSAVDKVIIYISENFTREVSNSELAALVGYHEFHLNRLFVKYTGTSIHQYIINKRLSAARELMLSSDLSLAEISEQVGFNNYSFFSSYFKKRFGISPAKFRSNSQYISP